MPNRHIRPGPRRGVVTTLRPALCRARDDGVSWLRQLIRGEERVGIMRWAMAVSTRDAKPVKLRRKGIPHMQKHMWDNG